MKLSITLSAQEAANIADWVRGLRARPEWIGKTGNFEPGKPQEYQRRIVLEDQTRERFDEIAQQVDAWAAPVSIVPFEPNANSTPYRHYGVMHPGVIYSFPIVGAQRCDIAVTGSVFVGIGLAPVDIERQAGMSTSPSVWTPEEGGLVYFQLLDASKSEGNAILNTLPAQ